MEGIEKVEQLSDTMTHWRVKAAGVKRGFDARTTEQIPDERVAWHSVEGPEHAGVVTFHRIGESVTRVTTQMEIDPDGLTEKAADRAGLPPRAPGEGDLKRFKAFIEDRGRHSGTWRGEVPRPQP